MISVSLCLPALSGGPVPTQVATTAVGQTAQAALAIATTYSNPAVAQHPRGRHDGTIPGLIERLAKLTIQLEGVGEGEPLSVHCMV